MDESMKALNTTYLDMVLIHWPEASKDIKGGAEGRIETWKAMEEYKKKGLVKAIGLSNFKVFHIEEMLPHITEKIATN